LVFFVSINEEEPTLKQSSFYFEVQSVGSAKIGKGVPNSSTGHAKAKK